jgi:hypothetical protein
MIHYDLQCGKGHRFDGWFRDSAAFDAQAARGLVECPECGGNDVARALMAPRVARTLPTPQQPAPEAETAAPAPEPPAKPQAPVAVGGAKLPAQVLAMLQRLRAEVERNCDYVGPQFAAEARRIHEGEAEVRGIYGEATPEEAESLTQDGIEVSRIPWVPRADG